MNDPSDNPLGKLLREIHERSLWQVLGVYTVSGWVVFEVAQSMTEGLGLPDWLPGFAFVVLLLGLPVVLATAIVQHRGRQQTEHATPTETLDAAVTSSPLTQSPVAQRILTWTNATLIGLGALVGGTLVALMSRDGAPRESTAEASLTPSVSIAAGARDVIAVLPFRTSGSDLEHLEEGLMDLLSRGLAQANVIATVDPRTVMKGLREIGSGDDIDVAQALSLAPVLGATSVLLGSAVSTGAEVRLDARLHRVGGDLPITAQATGSPESLLALADELAVSLVRDLWDSTAPLPNLDAGAVTTRSPEALRAFLEGERLYRLGELREARRVLEEAVRVDSTFALAHYRLGWARAWTEGLNAATTVAQLLSASEFSDRLPEREQRLVEGFLMLVEDRLEEGLALLEPYVRRWPDDPEAWFLVANYQWHHPEWMGRTTAQVLEPFDRVIALDSTLTIAYRHPLQLALHNRDKELYDRYMQPLRRFVADLESNSGWRTYLRQAAACFEGAPDVDPLPLAARLSGEPNHPPPCAADR